MQPIPDDILKQFNAVLKEKTVPDPLLDDYRHQSFVCIFRVKEQKKDSSFEPSSNCSWQGATYVGLSITPA